MNSALQPIVVALLDMFAPLDRALHDPNAFRVLLRNLGWERELEDIVLSQPPLADLANAVTELISAGDELVAALKTLHKDEDANPLIDELIDVIGSLRDFVAGLGDLDTVGLPPSLDDPAFWAQLSLDLPEYLIVRYFERYQPVLYALLRLVGVIQDDEETLDPDDANRLAYVRRIIVWDNLIALIADPAAHLQQFYHWNDSQPLAHGRLLDELARVVAATRVRYERLAVRPKLVDDHFGGTPPAEDVRELAFPILRGSVDGAFTEQGILLVPVPRSPSRAIDGLYLSNISFGSLVADVPLAPSDWRLIVSGALDATGAVGARLRPGELTILTPPTDGHFELAVEGMPAEPWLLLGSTTGGVRLQVSGLRLALAIDTATDAEIIFTIATLSSDGRGGIALTIDPAEGDSFARALVPEPIDVGVDLDFRWSSRTGLSVGGAFGLDVTLPLNKTVGPITIESVHIICSAGDGGASIVFAVTGGAALGPFAVHVEDIGFALNFVPGAEDGLVGDLQIAARFKSPTGLGFTLDIEGIVTGGGFISHDPELGRYSGALALDFLEVGLAAVVVVDTQLPGNPDGWALFASISATFPNIPLGFGFFLSGVGGIVCLNRTMDTEALAIGLKVGAIDALLFPDDPLVDAPLIISQLDAWFPQAEGSTVFGVAVTITWGAPKTLVTGELGVMLSFPDLNLAVVGSISMALPDEEHTLLELHMDTLGTVDVSEVTVSVVASLYDSSLLRTIQLSGDMAMYGQFGANPFFLLSVGGYHPNFRPPGYLPASVTELRRVGYELALSDDVWCGLYSYVAVTSNTLQFGAQVALEVSDRFLGVTYIASGSVGFDVLLHFSPFSFAADLYASVTMSAKDTELLAVSLSAHLEGPQPWYLSGSARFEFLGIGVRFDVVVGGASGVQALPRVSIRDVVIAALAAPEAWRLVAPAGQSVLLAADTEADDGIVRVRPDAELEAVQTAAPLERTMDVYGIYAIDGPNILHIDDAGIDGASEVTWAPVTDWFAPAMYDQLSRVDKIAAPSYEEMTAGVHLSAGGVSFGNDTQSVTPDYEVRVLNEDATQPLGRQPLLGTLASVTASLVLDRAHRPGVPRTVSGLQPFTVAAPGWTLIDAETGTSKGTPASYSDVLNQLHNRTAKDPTAHGRLRIAPVHATREAV